MSSLPSSTLNERQATRQRLLAARERFVASPEAAAASEALAKHLEQLLQQLAPECLGVYWPHRSEFNAARPWPGDAASASLSLALPFAQRLPVAMHYRHWDGGQPALRDECGMPTPDAVAVEPDVLLVPCLGYTVQGFRLGYGGGYFDRYLAAHPHVTAIGVAWSVARLSDAEFVPEPHDQPLMLVVDEHGVVG